MQYLVIYEKTITGFSAYVPDLPGIAVTGPTQEHARELMRTAIPLHIQGLIEDGHPIPNPSISEYIEVAV